MAKLREKKYPFFAVYLFGSYAQGRANKNSDIDVAVVSDRLKNNWNENEEKLWKYTMEVDSRIEPVGFTQKDFKQGADPLIFEIKKTGIKVV
jgi:predicted nucleotidyltransferase